MSLLWRDELAISLAPRRIALVRRTGAPGRRVVAATEVAVPGNRASDLGPVLGRLAEALADRTWQGATARAMVADHPWARFAILPPPAGRLDAAGRLAQARYVLGDAHGEAVADWAVTLADSPPGRSCVACAMPATVRGELQEVLAPARVALISLQPRLVVAFNAWRHRLPANDAWFVSADDGSLSAVHLTRGAWDRVHLARLSPDWSVELERLQALGRLTRAAGAPGRMLVDAPAAMRRGAGAGAGIEWLEEDGGEGAPAHELGLLQRMCA